MGRGKRRLDAAKKRQTAYNIQYESFEDLSKSMFKWTGLPEGNGDTDITERYIEDQLYEKGRIGFMMDEVVGLIAMHPLPIGKLNTYGEPLRWEFVGQNGYKRIVDSTDCVIMYNNKVKTGGREMVEYYARIIADLDVTITMNAWQQKCSDLILCDEKEQFSMKQIYEQYDGMSPVIFARPALNANSVTHLSTNTPYVGDKLYALKMMYYNELLTRLGISNVNSVKKERLISDEVSRSMGGTVAKRHSRLSERQNACRMINKKFGTNIWCEYRPDYQIVREDEAANANGGKEAKAE